MRSGQESLGRHCEEGDADTHVLPDPILKTQQNLLYFLVKLRKNKLSGSGRELEKTGQCAAQHLPEYGKDLVEIRTSSRSKGQQHAAAK